MRIVKGSLERCFEVIELLAADAQWHRLSDVAVRLDMQKGPTHRLLAELMGLGWIEQDAATERYRLTLKLSLCGQQYLQSTGLPSIVQPILDDVARHCRELVRLTVVQGDVLHWFASAQGAAPGLMYQPSLIGRPLLHATANGKAWLATLSNETATELALRSGLGQKVATTGGQKLKTLVTVKGLLEELAIIRKRGYALAVEEAELGVKAIAIAVRAFDGERALRSVGTVGTISIAGPLMRMGTERDPAFYALLSTAAQTLRMVWPRDLGTQLVAA